MSLSRFRAEPCQGQLTKLKRICGYLREYPKAAIRFRVQTPANKAIFGDMEDQDWMHSVYGDDVVDEMLEVYPPPKGVVVRTSGFKDANLMFCKVTGKSLEGVVS